MARDRAFQSWRKRRRVQDRLRDRPLILDREPDDLGLFHGAIRGFLRRRDDEIAYTAPLQLGCALHDSQGIRSYPQLPRRAVRFGFLGASWGLFFRSP